jgi:hypothetical protein
MTYRHEGAMVGGDQARPGDRLLPHPARPGTDDSPTSERKITMQHDTETAPPDHFPTETTGLPACRRPEVIELADGDALDLEISAVAKQLGDATVRMLPYNGSIPGPTLKVAQGSDVEVNVINHGDLARALARASPGEPLRRHPRGPGADPGWRKLPVARDVPRPGPLSRDVRKSRLP